MAQFDKWFGGFNDGIGKATARIMKQSLRMKAGTSNITQATGD